MFFGWLQQFFVPIFLKFALPRLKMFFNKFDWNQRRHLFPSNLREVLKFDALVSAWLDAGGWLLFLQLNLKEIRRAKIETKNYYNKNGGSQIRHFFNGTELSWTENVSSNWNSKHPSLKGVDIIKWEIKYFLRKRGCVWES